MESLNWKIMTWSVGLFCAASLVLCVLCGLVVPRAWHETLLYGAYAGLVFPWVHNAVARRVRMHA